MLKDLSPDVFTKVYQALGVVPLSKANCPPYVWPLHGIVNKKTRRVFVSVPVSHDNKDPVNVVFLVDTGSTATYLAQETLDVLCGEDMPIPKKTKARLNGLETTVFLSPKKTRLDGLNLLGMDYLAQHKCHLYVDGRTRKCSIDRCK